MNKLRKRCSEFQRKKNTERGINVSKKEQIVGHVFLFKADRQIYNPAIITFTLLRLR